MTPANDNTPARARMIPLIGSLNVDTGRLLPATVVSLVRLPPGSILGPIRWPADIVPFPSDHREA